MPYRFLVEKQDYTDFSAGRVIYALPGHPAFPVRLAAEIFERCQALRAAQGSKGPALVFDPCCGGAYHLTALAYLYPDSIAGVAASDIDPEAVALAGRNLSLLTLAGLNRRAAELSQLYSLYRKESHAGALESAGRLRKRLEAFSASPPLATRLFQADAADPQALRPGLEGWQADLVITDLPYGRLSTWQANGLPEPGSLPPAGLMLAALRGFLAPGGVVAIASDKEQKVSHPAFRQIGKLRQGKRQVVFLEEH